MLLFFALLENFKYFIKKKSAGNVFVLAKILHVTCCMNQRSNARLLIHDHSFPMGRPMGKSERGKLGLGVG